MPRSIVLAGLLSCSALVQPAFAEVSPEDVWADFKSYMESFGYAVTATESGGGDVLNVADVIMTVDLPEGEGTFAVELGDLTFTDAGGSVDVAFPNVMPIRFDVTPEDDVPAKGTVEYRHTGLTMNVSGEPDDMEYTYAAEELEMVLTDLEVDGETIGRDEARIDVSMENVEGTTTMRKGDTRAYDQTFSMSGLAYDMFFTEGEGAMTLAQFAGKFADVAMTSTASLPLDMEGVDVAQMMAAGLAGDFKMTHAGGQSSMNVTEDGEITAFSSTSESGDFTIGMTETSLMYGTSAKGVDMQIAGAELPFPIALKAAETSASLSAPVAKTDTAEDFAFGFTLGGFEMNDMIWNMFDPGKALPRDPATLALDLSGKAKMLFDVLDPAQAEALEDADMPAEVESLSLDALTIEAAGAKITGDGAFTFDNNDLASFDGFPRPEGALNLQVNGANKLIDTLVSMGILPEEQAMGARMMMAMFAKPEGDDVLSSKIEINAQGHILANGQRIQ